MRKKRDKKEEKVDESWLLPYADMLTLLLALFIILFAMSEIDVRKFEQLSQIFQSEFSSGGGIIDEGISIVTDDLPLGPDLSDVRDEDEELGLKEEEEEGEDSQEAAEEEEIARLRGLEFDKLRSVQQELEEYIDLNSLTETLGTKLTGEGLLVTISTDITFDSGRANVKEEGQKIAKKIAQFLNTDPPQEIVVSGHADDRPMNNHVFASNWELSSMRAIQFMYLLLEHSKIEPKWFSSRGFGEYRPIVPNTSEENRAKNRRVEVLIQPNFTGDLDDNS